MARRDEFGHGGSGATSYRDTLLALIAFMREWNAGQSTCASVVLVHSDHQTRYTYPHKLAEVCSAIMSMGGRLEVTGCV